MGQMPKAGSPRREAGPRDQCRQRAGRMFVEVKGMPSLGSNGGLEGAGCSSWGRGALGNGRTLLVEGGCFSRLRAEGRVAKP